MRSGRNGLWTDSSGKVKPSIGCWPATASNSASTKTENSRDLFSRLRRSPYRNYTRKQFRGQPGNEQVIYILVLTQTASAQEIASQITRRLGGSVRTVLSPAAEYPGFSYLKVYDRSASKSHMPEILKARTGAEKTVTFGSIPGQYDVYVHDDGGNSAVKALKKLFDGAPLEALGMD